MYNRRLLERQAGIAIVSTAVELYTRNRHGVLTLHLLRQLEDELFQTIGNSPYDEDIDSQN